MSYQQVTVRATFYRAMRRCAVGGGGSLWGEQVHRTCSF